MKLKRNDNVKILAGKDKGKTGKIIQVFPVRGKVVVEGVNKMVKNLKARQRGEKGQKIEFSAPLDISNVILVCPKCQVPIRVSHTMIESKSVQTASGVEKHKKFRFCKRCKESF